MLSACSADLPTDIAVTPKDGSTSDKGQGDAVSERVDAIFDNAAETPMADAQADRADNVDRVDTQPDGDDGNDRHVDDDGRDDDDADDDVADDTADDADDSFDGAGDVPEDARDDISFDARDADGDTSDAPGWTGTPVDPRFSRFVRFAVVGDYGTVASDEGRIANLIASWTPDFVVTTGDNIYTGLETGYDDAVGQFYSSFIGNYRGKYGPGNAATRFWPTPGNHDWDTGINLAPYVDYFTLPGNERYYDIALGLVHLFAIDSDPREPDGTTADSIQGRWLQDRLSKSTSCFNLVFFHHPAYSSGPHGSSVDMQWPFEAWGADAVLAGHDHVYERFEVGQIPYFTIGLGGGAPYAFVSTIPESRAQFNSDFAAMRLTATRRGLRFEVIDGSGNIVETWSSRKRCR